MISGAVSILRKVDRLQRLTLGVLSRLYYYRCILMMILILTLENYGLYHM